MSTDDVIVDERMADPVKVYYADDPDRQKAGQGLAFAPLIHESLRGNHSLYWLMCPGEQVAMIYLLERLRPKVAIEIGSAFGGSLQVISQYAEHVYSLDIDPLVPKRLEGLFPNVEYVIGPTDDTLPPLIDRLQAQGAELSFALVDGDHSSEGVRKDINNLLQFRPSVPFYIIMHDSFNEECRDGVRRAAWAASPFVHAVELDFIGGAINPSPEPGYELWGGLALGIVLPEPRKGHFEVVEKSRLTYKAAAEARQRLLKPQRSIARRALGKLRRLLAHPS